MLIGYPWLLNAVTWKCLRLELGKKNVHDFGLESSATSFLERLMTDEWFLWSVYISCNSNQKNPLLWHSCPCDPVWITKNSDKMIYCRQISPGVQYVQQGKEAGREILLQNCILNILCASKPYLVAAFLLWRCNGTCKMGSARINKHWRFLVVTLIKSMFSADHLHSFHCYSAYISMLMCLSI